MGSNELALTYEIIIGTMFILFIGMSLNINNFNYTGIVYGVRVPNKYRRDEKIKVIDREYKKRSVISVTLLTIIFSIMIFKIPKAWVSLIYVFIIIFLQFYLYSLANKKMKKVKEETGWKKEFANKVYIEIKSSKKNIDDNNDYDIRKRWFIASFVIAIITLIFTIVKYSSLPDLVPIHFGINGEPDGFADLRTTLGKIELFMIPVMSIILVFIMYFCTALDYKKRKSARLNGGTYNQIQEKKEISGKALNSMMGGTAFSLSIIMLWVVLLTLGIVKPNKTSFDITMVLTFGMVIYVTIYTIYLMSKNKDVYKKYDSNSKEYYTDDDDKFKWGIFYYNKKDPALLIERRMGMGFDFNYGNEKAVVITIILGFFIISSIVMTFVMNV
ncbi:MAG: DUF1648 domain-containing protein [Clostridium sp.]|uniref:DUF1648 domain-containing protein n=1 Tax=Clostridium sp. TaxID=1506 RepID=UPI003F3456D0